MGIKFGRGVKVGPGIRLQYQLALTPPGQQAYTTPGTYSFIVPTGVTSLCAVCIGAGSSGGTGNGGSSGYSAGYSPGGNGGARIIWGPGRSFPSTNTGDI